jgi:hypothetical protein
VQIGDECKLHENSKKGVRGGILLAMGPLSNHRRAAGVVFSGRKRRETIRWPHSDQESVMKKLWIISLLFLLAGCSPKDSAEKVSQDLDRELRGVSAFIDSVSDEPSANAAVAQIDAAKARLLALGDRYAKVAPNEAEKKKIRDQIAFAIGDFGSRMVRVAQRNYKAGEIVAPSILDLIKALSEGNWRT